MKIMRRVWSCMAAPYHPARFKHSLGGGREMSASP